MIFERVLARFRKVGVVHVAKTTATDEDVTRTRLFVTVIDDWEEIGRAHRAVFGEIQPAASMVQVQWLIDPRLCVEIEANAVIPESSGSQ